MGSHYLQHSIMTQKSYYFVNKKGHFLLELLIVLGIICVIVPPLISSWLNFQLFIKQSQEELRQIMQHLSLKYTLQNQLNKGHNITINQNKVKFEVPPYIYELSHDIKTGRLKRVLYSSDTLRRRHSSYLTENDVIKSLKFKNTASKLLTVELETQILNTSMNYIMEFR